MIPTPCNDSPVLNAFFALPTLPIPTPTKLSGSNPAVTPKSIVPDIMLNAFVPGSYTFAATTVPGDKIYPSCANKLFTSCLSSIVIGLPNCCSIIFLA